MEFSPDHLARILSEKDTMHQLEIAIKGMMKNLSSLMADHIPVKIYTKEKTSYSPVISDDKIHILEYNLIVFEREKWSEFIEKLKLIKLDSFQKECIITLLEQLQSAPQRHPTTSKFNQNEPAYKSIPERIKNENIGNYRERPYLP